VRVNHETVLALVRFIPERAVTPVSSQSVDIDDRQLIVFMCVVTSAVTARRAHSG
jgi:hypothetical protein